MAKYMIFFSTIIPVLFLCAQVFCIVANRPGMGGTFPEFWALFR